VSSTTLRGKRVLITQADAFMGPMLCEVFAEHGASVIANTQSLVHPEAPAAVVVAAGRIDVLVASLACQRPPRRQRRCPKLSGEIRSQRLWTTS
jgi:2-keto-3-deoxy-L-fuconate dehydrogenase